MPYLVEQALVELFIRYDGDLGLMDERWANPKDREAFGSEQLYTLGQSIDQVSLAKSPALSSEYRLQIENRIKDLQKQIEPEAIMLLQNWAGESLP
ncbi:MAG: hypothetical protein NTX35_02255 [Verrucomicrobia bacterium]|jgi:hypothetical protein|nr:hypothetical protein [Verrucomicrobiota bacterium]